MGLIESIRKAAELDSRAHELIGAYKYQKGQPPKGDQNIGTTVVTAADIEQARAEDQR